MEKLEERLEKSKKLIEKEIARYTPKGNLYDAVRYSLESGGKKLRPFLCIESGRLLNCDTKKALPFAIACEFMHNWLLVHDDIEDGDEIRRNKPTVWKKFGVAHAINAGDIMAHKVFEIILNSNLPKEKILKLIELVLKVATETYEGQTLEFNFKNNQEVSEENYIKIAMKKTGYYLACPMLGAAIIAGSNKKVLTSLLEYGENIGIVFQITDDIIDLTTGKGRLEIGCDIKEGKKTLMVLHALRNCNLKERQKILKILRKPREKTTLKDILYVKTIFKKYNSIEYGNSKAIEFAEKAKKSTRNLPENLRDFLEEFVNYVVQRQV